MAKTPSGNSVPLLSPANFLLMVDRTVIGQVLAEGIGRNRRPVADSALETDERLAHALLVATGELEATCLRGERYTAGDLAALTGASAAYRDLMLRDLTMQGLWYSRTHGLGRLPEMYKQTAANLQALGDGQEIFALDETEEAGLPDHEIMDDRDFQNAQLASTIASRLFGRRVRSYPQRSGG